MKNRVGPLGLMCLPDDYQTFKDRVENWNSFSGGTELTFAGLKNLCVYGQMKLGMIPIMLSWRPK